MNLIFGLEVPSTYYDVTEFQWYQQDAKRIRAGQKWVSTSGNFIAKNHIAGPRMNYKFVQPPSSNPYKEIVQIQMQSGRFIYWLIEKHTAINGDITITPLYEIEPQLNQQLFSVSGEPLGLVSIPDYYYYKRKA